MSVFRARSLGVSGMLLIGLAALIARLFYIQVVRAEAYAERSLRQSTSRTVVKAPRGKIRDRNGYLLAQSLDKPGFTPKAGTPRGNRIYPYGRLAGAILGYVGTDGYGLGGVEYTFDEQLRGEDGWIIQQRDGRNNKYSRIDLPAKRPVSGSDIYLTIDVHIQEIVENVLSRTVQTLDAVGGMCVVMDPETGEVLAMAGEPAFDPNNSGEYPLAERMNKCITYNYEPGSTFKVFTAAAALEEKALEPTDTLDGNDGIYEIYGEVIRDHRPFAKLTFAEALHYSSNVCFARVADQLGNRSLYNYALNFGLGTRSGIDLPGEEAGIVHPIHNWSGRTRVTMAMGQEVSVTLLQMVLGFAAVANGGVLVVPKICARIEGTDKQGEENRPAVRRVISPGVAETLRETMIGVVAEGTGTAAKIPGVSIAGKTGTGQKIDPETGTYEKDKVCASFIGFAPANSPKLVCGIVIDEPREGMGGGQAAAPAFREILSQMISHPKLRYARVLVEEESEDVRETAPGVRMPDVCLMNRKEAENLLEQNRIVYEVIGTGDVVKAQSPASGGMVRSNARAVIYLSSIDGEDGNGQVIVPNCIGKDLRDAIHAVGMSGLIPFAHGMGTVREQRPTVGTLTESGVVCTLFCSLDG